MLYLAVESGSESRLFQAQEISEAQDIPPHYLKQILSRLRAAGLVRSTRGPAGGHGLARPAADISVGEIIQCLEGQLTSINAILDMPCSIRVGPQNCAIKRFLTEVKLQVERVLFDKSLASLAQHQDELVQASLVQPAFLTAPKRD